MDRHGTPNPTYFAEYGLVNFLPLRTSCSQPKQFRPNFFTVFVFFLLSLVFSLISLLLFAKLSCYITDNQLLSKYYQFSQTLTLFHCRYLYLLKNIEFSLQNLFFTFHKNNKELSHCKNLFLYFPILFNNNSLASRKTVYNFVEHSLPLLQLQHFLTAARESSLMEQ